ncbi:MAG: hypothetical protein OYH76_18310 [Defluviicoccus sp.]|nr:hypothetical protein [Defluviicoccus sp.]MDE0277852.1 hypothetical protein [Defluviicoccus sp.]
MKPPATGITVDVSTLHPESDNDPTTITKWCGRQQGKVVKLVDSGDDRYPHDPAVCLEIAGEDGTLYAWFLTSDIWAGMLVPSPVI